MPTLLSRALVWSIADVPRGVRRSPTATTVGAGVTSRRSAGRVSIWAPTQSMRGTPTTRRIHAQSKSVAENLGVDRLSAPVLGAPGVIVCIDRIPHEFDAVRVGFDYRLGEEYRPLR
jgi:hypothetical protein